MRVPQSNDVNRPVAFEMNQMPWIGDSHCIRITAISDAVNTVNTQGSRKDVRVGTAGEAEA
ncbi:hypothetical protein GCM10023156_66250 [Novipirellula rosea]|uniref:Uncharacterized protein n=1 Tax=Novipirellula rosea TaxID=1031540 RepID=A0ABP8NUS3_9BACT